MSVDDQIQDRNAETSDVWRDFASVEESPGFSLRTTYPTNAAGVEVMLERWDAGTEEPPHSHPGDDMTVVVKGRMSPQVYRRAAGSLLADGGRGFLGHGE